MARNEEKSQSMLFRFREVQAIEAGVSGGRNARRPRLASSCDSLKECERWRGEILREISRKVSKIQDVGLTDYEIRDLNDEINKLMREKKHWERQIVALGGANYTRNTAMLDEDGKQVPGTRGYKYFGRAKDLPGVKELFAKKVVAADEESARGELYQRFQNQGPDYYGDFDEGAGELLMVERKAEVKDWDDAYARLAALLSLPSSSAPLPFPIPSSTPAPPPPPSSSTAAPAGGPSTKRAAADEGAPEDADADAPMAVDGDEPPAPASPSSKKAKLSGSDGAAPAPAAGASDDDAKTTAAAAAAAAAQAQAQAAGLVALRVLKQADLAPPALPTKDEMERFLLERRKSALLAEYA